MPLDPNIILSGRMPQLDNPLDVANKALTMKQLSQSAAIRDREMADDSAMRSALQSNFQMDENGAPKLNQAGVLSSLSKSSPMQALSMQDKFRQMNAAEREQHVKDFTEKAKIGKELAYSVPTGPNVPLEIKQRAWSEMRAQGIKFGLPNAETLPEQYLGDNAMIIMQKKSDDAHTQWQDQWKQRDYDQKDREIDSKNKNTSAGTITELRKERSNLPTTKATQIMSASFNKMQSAKTTAAGDLSLVFGYMKMLDPESSVREGEQATAQNARGVPDGVMNLWNQMQTGAKLTAAQRADFLNHAAGLYKGQLDVQKQVDDQFGILAERAGADRKDVLLNFEANQPVGKKQKDENQLAKNPSVPKVGAVMDGHRFKGGDPSIQSSWEPLKADR